MVDSKLINIQRFLAEFIVDTNLIAKLIFSLLLEKPPYQICLDRTHWKYGIANINILMISIAYQGIAAPFHWTLLPKRGNSNTAERTELVQRFISFFGEGCIEAILPDREFIGDVWFRALIHRKIPFYIRIRYNLWIDIPGKGPTSSFW